MRVLSFFIPIHTYTSVVVYNIPVPEWAEPIKVVSKSLGAERCKMSVDSVTNEEQSVDGKYPSLLRREQELYIESTQENIDSSKRKGQAERLEQARRNVDCLIRISQTGIVKGEEFEGVKRIIKANMTILGEAVPAPEK